MPSKYIFLSILIFFSVGKITARVKFTNIKCTSLDTNFDDFEYCRLKSVNRTFKYISLKVNLYKIPITKVKVKFALLKQVSGQRSFLYNITADACKILKYPKSNPVFGFFYNLFRDHSNINHTCPLSHDLIVDKFPTEFMNTPIINVLPFPLGDYQFHSTWIADDISRAEVRVYGTLF